MSKQVRSSKPSKLRHLICPFGTRYLKTPSELVRGREELKKAHDWIVQHVLEHWAKVKLTRTPHWGILEKRQPVGWDERTAPSLVGKGEEGLGEIISQMSNAERLIDVLHWCETQFPTAVIDVCHPTTSSANGEYDLHLLHRGEVLYFEVTDNVGGNNNYKVEESLAHYAFLERIRKGAYCRREVSQPPTGKLHLVASAEMGDYIDVNGRKREEEWGVQFGRLHRVGDCSKSITCVVSVERLVAVPIVTRAAPGAASCRRRRPAPSE